MFPQQDKRILYPRIRGQQRRGDLIAKLRKKHPHQSSVPRLQKLPARRFRRTQDLEVHCYAQSIVHVQQTRDRTAKHGFLWTFGSRLQTRVRAQKRPRFVLVIDVLQLQTRVREKGLQIGRMPRPKKLAHLRNLLFPPRRKSRADAAQNNLSGLPVQLHVTSCGQKREPTLHLALNVAARASQQRAQAQVEPELSAMKAALVAAQAALGSVGDTADAA
jgi:hypothetical protein